MHFIVLLCILTRILANCENIFDDWENTQVFIYKRRIGTPNSILKPHLYISEIKPSCFGILLTSKHVITAISCFFDVTQLNNPNVKLLETFKFNPEKAFVVIVIIIISCSPDPTTNSEFTLPIHSISGIVNCGPQFLFVDFFCQK